MHEDTSGDMNLFYRHSLSASQLVLHEYILQKYGTQLNGFGLFEQKFNRNNSALFVPPCRTQIVRQRRPEWKNKYGNVCMQLVLSQRSHFLHCTAMDVGDDNEMG